ncbi:MAG TPA: hypothetical protein VGR30_15820 [Candidatus Binatia bacterium]|nr:hypothetical protein [Candidatus Binatia bacterium]
MSRKGGQLWLMVGLVLTIVGCAVDQRTVVIRPEEVARQNDTDWKIAKEPQRGQQAGQR